MKRLSIFAATLFFLISASVTQCMKKSDTSTISTTQGSKINENIFCKNLNSFMINGKNKWIASTIIDSEKEALLQANPDDRLTLARKLVITYIFEHHINHLEIESTKKMTQEVMLSHVPTIAKLIIDRLPNQ
jgi:hypothetical protein